MEENNLYSLGEGTTGAARREAARERVQSPFEGMTCPSRRDTNVYDMLSAVSSYYNCATLDSASKTDYACNGGDTRITETSGGPPSETAAETNAWRSDTSDYRRSMNGICFERSEISFRKIIDGLSKTYMAGEKWMWHEDYETGLGRQRAGLHGQQHRHDPPDVSRIPTLIGFAACQFKHRLLEIRKCP